MVYPVGVAPLPAATVTIADLSLATAVGVSGVPGATFSHEYLRMNLFVALFVPPTTMIFPDASNAIEVLSKFPLSAAFVLKPVSATPADEYLNSAVEVPAIIFPSLWIAREMIDVDIAGNASSTEPSAL
jgi:hypothetical protein